MGVIRLVALAVLLYIGLVLIRAITGKSRKDEQKGTGGKACGNSPVQDVLVEDPVCHTYIPKGQAVQLHHDKKMYYFCSEKCCDKFLKEKGDE